MSREVEEKAEVL